MSFKAHVLSFTFGTAAFAAAGTTKTAFWSGRIVTPALWPRAASGQIAPSNPHCEVLYLASVSLAALRHFSSVFLRTAGDEDALFRVPRGRPPARICRPSADFAEIEPQPPICELGGTQSTTAPHRPDAVLEELRLLGLRKPA